MGGCGDFNEGGGRRKKNAGEKSQQIARPVDSTYDIDLSVIRFARPTAEELCDLVWYVGMQIIGGWHFVKQEWVCRMRKSNSVSSGGMAQTDLYHNRNLEQVG